MNRIGSLGRGFADEGVLDAGAVAAIFLLRSLGPEVRLAALALLAREPVLFEERDGELFFTNLIFH